jgi:hypothetical protein
MMPAIVSEGAWADRIDLDSALDRLPKHHLLTLTRVVRVARTVNLVAALLVSGAVLYAASSLPPSGISATTVSQSGRFSKHGQDR